MLVGRGVVLGGGQRCGNSIHISDPAHHRAPGLTGQGVRHLGPMREGCLGEEASEQDRERSRVWMGQWEEVQASQAAGMAHRQRHRGRKGMTAAHASSTQRE